MYNTGASCIGGDRTSAKAEVEGKGIAVSVELTGLSPGTEYTYCLVASNPSGATFGQPQTATTLATFSPPEAPITETCGGQVGPGVVQPGVVRWCGTLNPHASSKVGYYFAYNTGASCVGGNRTPAEAEVEGKGIKVFTEPTGLEPGTEYTYCLVAANAHGEAFGEGLTFKSEGEPISESPPHEVQTEPAEQTVDGFKLKGKLNPENSPTRYYFIYKKVGEVECEDLEGCGPETAYGGPLNGDTQQEVPPMEVTHLTPGTTYVYWLIAWNAKGTTRGNELTFMVSSPPSIDSESASKVTQNDTTLEAQINPNGRYTDYEFQIYTIANGNYNFTTNCPFQIPGYGQCEEYVLMRPPGLVTSQPQYIAAGSGDQTVSVDLASIGLTLQPSSTYNYRVVAANTAQIIYGQDQAFTTPGVQSNAGQGDTTVSGTGTTSGPITSLVSTVTPLLNNAPKPKAEVLTNAQKLAKALKTCNKKPKWLRAKCAKQAKDKYGNHAMTTKKKSSK
jgi:hypothetical protein